MFTLSHFHQINEACVQEMTQHDAVRNITNRNNNDDEKLNVSNIDNVCIKTLLTKFDKKILYSMQPLIDQFEQMGQLSRLTYDLCILYCLCDIRNIYAFDFGTQFLNTHLLNFLHNRYPASAESITKFQNHEIMKNCNLTIAMRVLQTIMLFASNVTNNDKKTKCNEQTMRKMMIDVKYICKDLEITGMNKKYPDPIKIAKKYSKQAFLDGQRMNVVVDQQNRCFYQSHAIDKNRLKQDAQRLRNNQARWQCYYCASVNNANNDECKSCGKGLNPLYFSVKNKSQCFTVNPQNFGIIRLSCLSNSCNVRLLYVVVFCF